MGVITLTTDFGDVGGDAARLKGAIYKSNPNATVVDIAHRIKPGSVAQAAFTILSTHKAFPEDTVHFVTVTPDVTKTHRTICLEIPRVGWFVGPDNGVFSYLVDLYRHVIAYELPGSTNRPILPAVQLAQGAIVTQMGGLPVNPSELHGLDYAYANWADDKKQSYLKGKVIHINHRGGVVTNVTREHIGEDKNYSNREIKVYLPSKLLIAHGIKQDYDDCKPEETFAVINPYGFLSIVRLNGYVVSPYDDCRYVDEPITVELG